MGRPEDKFCWDNVEKLEDNRWKCNHCKEEFSGGATRIRNHLSGEGKEIQSCEELQGRTPRKRGRHSSVAKASAFEGPSSSNFNGANYATDERRDTNSELLVMNRGTDDSVLVQKSMLNLKAEVTQYMKMVRESWKKSGCTMMAYRFMKRKGELCTVIGFYCPKGFIFVEGPPADWSDGEFLNFLKCKSQNFCLDDVTRVVHNDGCLCDLESDFKGISKCSSITCKGSAIKRIFNSISMESKWAQDLIKKAEMIHNFMFEDSDLYNWYHNSLREKGFQEYEYVKLASPLSRFLSIMLLQDDLKMRFQTWPSSKLAPINDSEFWNEGRKLERAVTPISKIPKAMDTFVPTSGYLQMTLHRVSKRVIKDIQDEKLRYELRFYLESNYKFYESTPLSPLVIAHLNPMMLYLLEENENFIEDMKEAMSNLSFIISKKEKPGEIDEQLERYSNKWRTLFPHTDGDHPVKLWERYGNDLPLLRKYAIKILSQPATCMCNQVKKHLFELEGEDDYMLKLNARMMEEFRNLSDSDIYMPFEDFIQKSRLFDY